MDKEGVDLQVLSPIPVTFSYWAEPNAAEEMAHIQNDFIAETVKQYPSRFIGLGTVPLQDVDVSIREMERCMFQLGLKGIEIGTNVNGKNLDDPSFSGFFEMAEKWNVPLFVHPWETLGRERMPRHHFMYTVGMPSETALAAASLINGAVMEKYPTLKVCFAHGEVLSLIYCRVWIKGGTYGPTSGRFKSLQAFMRKSFILIRLTMTL